MKLHRLENHEIEVISTLFSESFFEDPLFVYFFPEPQTRIKKAKSFFKAELMRCQSFSFTNEDLSGAIVFQKAHDKIRRIRINEAFNLIQTVGLSSIVKALTYQRFKDRLIRHHDLKKFDSLRLICIKTEARNQGLATKMIQAFLTEKTFLETQNPSNLSFYKKLGFKLESTSNFLISAKINKPSLTHMVMVIDPIG